MADSTKSLDVVLRTRAELDGAIAMQQSLERQIGVAKALGRDYTDLKANLDRLNESIKGYAGPLEQTNEHMRETHLLFHKLNEIVPGLGHAMKAVFSPEAAGVMTGVIALEAFVDWMKEAKKHAEEFKKTMTEEADFSDIKNSVATLRDTMAGAAIKAADFISSLDEIINAKKTIADLDKDYDTQLQAQKKAMDEIAKAREKEAMTTLEMMREQGKITPQQFLAAQSRLQGNSDRESAAREVQMLQQEKAMAQRDLDLAKKAVEGGRPAEGAKEAAAAAADRNAKLAKQELDHAKAELENQKKLIAGDKDQPGLADKVNEARAHMEKFAVMYGADAKYAIEHQNDDWLRNHFLTKSGDAAVPGAGGIVEYLQLVDKLAGERQKESALASRIPQRETALYQANDEKALADKDLEQFKKSLDANSKSAEELKSKIEELTRELSSHQYDATVFAAKDAARAVELKASTQKEDDKQARKNLDTFEHGNGISMNVAPVQVNTKALSDAIRSMNSQQATSFQTQLDALAREIQMVDSRARNRP